MLSRVAESIYWMSRYVERAENVARFVDVNLHLMLDLPGAREQWMPLVDVTGDSEPFRQRYGKATKQNVIHFLTFDTENPNSILSCLSGARENARSVRESISTEMWQRINEAHLMVNAASRGGDALARPHEFYNEIKRASYSFVGVTDATMTHGEGWHFSRLGRMVERADKTTRILDVKYFLLLPSVRDVGSPYDDIQWAALLHSASAFEMYRQEHGIIRPDLVVAFLLHDRLFPRSVLYCLTKATESLHGISASPMNTFANPAEQLLGSLYSQLAYADVADIILDGLHEYLDRLQVKLNQVGEAVFETFFALRPIGGTLGKPAPLGDIQDVFVPRSQAVQSE